MILAYVQWVISFKFEDIAPMNRIAHIHCPVLLAHGTADAVTPIGDMQLIKENAPSDADLHILAIEDATHDSVDKFEANAGLLIDFIRAKLKTGRG